MPTAVTTLRVPEQGLGIVWPTDHHGPRGGPDRRHDPAGARAVTRRDNSRLDPPY
jgi:hypothetical protein